MSSNLSACCFRSIQHYKDNNLQLAINLNETRKENRTLNEVLTRKCSEYQQICVENSYLRAELAVKDKQLAMWHSAVADVVKNNTRGLTQLMTLLAPQSVATANNHNNGKFIFSVSNACTRKYSCHNKECTKLFFSTLLQTHQPHRRFRNHHHHQPTRKHKMFNWVIERVGFQLRWDAKVWQRTYVDPCQN